MGDGAEGPAGDGAVVSRPEGDGSATPDIAPNLDRGGASAPPQPPPGEISSVSLWWIAQPGEQPNGPFDLPTVAAMYRHGRVGPAAQLCAADEAGGPDGSGPQWRPIGSLLGPPSAPPTELSAIPTAAGRSVWQPRSLVGPILATIFCCMIGGIVAIVYTAQANTKGAIGDYQGAERDANTATRWLVACVLSPLAIIVAYFAAALIASVLLFATRGT